MNTCNYPEIIVSTTAGEAEISGRTANTVAESIMDTMETTITLVLGASEATRGAGEKLPLQEGAISST